MLSEMARRHRRRVPGRLRSLCSDAFLVLWVGGMVLRASVVVLAPLGRWLEPIALVLTTAFRR
jgi:hypothetical protein